jgi:hypothetical protein
MVVAPLTLPAIEQHFRQLFILFLNNYDFNAQLIAKHKKQIRCHKNMFIPSDFDKASIVNGSDLLKQLKITPMKVYLPSRKV